ncbi:MAG: hypothetical protein CMN91_09640 [Synechococcus sp. ARS1019]|nr:hypothetical protein [Synechococcus sp. ARS1019]
MILKHRTLPVQNFVDIRTSIDGLSVNLIKNVVMDGLEISLLVRFCLLLFALGDSLFKISLQQKISF